MQLVAVDSLEVGMMLAQDVITDSFVHIISESTIITQEIIEKLVYLDIDFVYIHDKESSQKKEKIPEAKFDPSTLEGPEALQYHFKQTLICIKSIYNDIKFGETKINENLSHVMSPLLELVLSHNNILYSLRCFNQNEEYIFKHSIEVGMLSAMIGKWLKLPKYQITELAIAGLLHDIGKIKTPQYILNKPGELTPQEFDIAKKHSEHGGDIIKEDGSFSQGIYEGVLYHHERYNGSGYPKGLEGINVPLYARIVAVADVFDAIISNKVYQLKLSPFKASETVKMMSFDELDPKITNLFLKKISEHYVGSKVLLSTGEEGEVIYLNKFSINKPLIKVGEKFIDLTMQPSISIKDILA